MIFWVVSDLNEKELMEFVRDFAAEKTVNPLIDSSKVIALI